MSYRWQSSAEGQLVRVKFETGGLEDGFGFDGEAILLESTKSLLGVSSAPSAPGGGTKSGPSIVSVLLAAKGTATDGTRKLPLELALVTEAHYVILAVSVPDGNIVIGMSDDGTAIIRSKEGTWNCKNASRGWTCTSESGDALDVAEDAAGGGT